MSWRSSVHWRQAIWAHSPTAASLQNRFVKVYKWYLLGYPSWRVGTSGEQGTAGEGWVNVSSSSSCTIPSSRSGERRVGESSADLQFGFVNSENRICI